MSQHWIKTHHLVLSLSTSLYACTLLRQVIYSKTKFLSNSIFAVTTQQQYNNKWFYATKKDISSPRKYSSSVQCPPWYTMTWTFHSLSIFYNMKITLNSFHTSKYPIISSYLTLLFITINTKIQHMYKFVKSTKIHQLSYIFTHPIHI